MIVSKILLLAAVTTPFNSPLVTIDVVQYGLVYFTNNRPVTGIRCHKAMVKPLITAFNCTQKAEKYLKMRMLLNFGGCYVPRKIHGTNRWSNHKWGTAIDINVPTPFSRGVNNQHKALVKCFKDQGFEWGGDWKNKDYMHFELPIKS